jgi:hypothetical protein
MGAQGVGVAALSATDKILCVAIAVVEARLNNKVYWWAHRQ